MADPYIGEIRIYPFDFAPKGWAKCDGQLLPVIQNYRLFCVINTTYGGDGNSTFALPDLRGRAPMHWGQGAGLSTRTLGEVSGEVEVILQSEQVPTHTHTLNASANIANSSNPENRVLATARNTAYGIYNTANPTQPLAATSVVPVGAGAAHNNMMPYLVLNFIIALDGVESKPSLLL